MGLARSICFGSHVGATDILTLLIKASATVTVYRGHRRTLLPAGINSLFIMCIGIIRNNSLVDGRARPSRTPATERVTLYCTWRPAALATRPRKQVSKCGIGRQIKIAVLVFQCLTGQAPAYLANDCQLTSDVSTRRLRSTDTATCNQITLSATGVLRLLDHVCGACCQSIYGCVSLKQFKRLLKTHLFGA